MCDTEENQITRKISYQAEFNIYTDNVALVKHSKEKCMLHCNNCLTLLENMIFFDSLFKHTIYHMRLT